MINPVIHRSESWVNVLSPFFLPNKFPKEQVVHGTNVETDDPASLLGGGGTTDVARGSL